MAATDQHYRNQRALDILFGASCVIMLLTIVWMFYDDFYRAWKVEARRFRDVEHQMAERDMIALLPDDLDAFGKAQKAVDDAKEAAKKARTETAGNVLAAQVAVAKADARYKSIKADYDSKESLLYIEIDNRDNADSARRPALEKQVTTLQSEVDRLRDSLTKAKVDLEEKTRKLEAENKPQATADETLAKAESELKKLRANFDRYQALARQKKFGWGDWLRSQPIIDGFAPPYAIKQYTLNEYPIDYNFKFVTRYDRCTTCHLGMEKENFTREALRDLRAPNEARQAQLKTFREGLASAGGKVGGFDINDLPSSLGTMQLTDSRVKQYAAHPRLDLFVHSNSPHSAEKFGCTSCHSGQGSATDFINATHSPNAGDQLKQWQKEHHWASIHFWDFPMLPSRFIESSCLKCHHQVTDLVRYGSKEEAPKLLKGYNLVRELGCFGCHDIAGQKAGRAVGPDMRLEPYPPLEALTPTERTKMLADVLNPPGTMRKVGPSLYRLSEKTNRTWVRQWLDNPRGFRPDTRMPHFYNLDTTTTKELPDTQQAFPAAEMQAISHYLFHEGAAYLDKKDKYRRDNEATKQRLEAKAQRNEKEERELSDLNRRLDLEDKLLLPPLKKRLTDGEGKDVTLPDAPKDQKARDELVLLGARLFREKGCLACHVHEAVSKSEGDVPAVESDAEFAPNLSRMAAKIAPEGGDDADKRRWLVQWVLNPNVHFPRTRMPITHLSVREASAIAEWLLNQRVTDWNAPDVANADPKTLVALTRVYLGKAPGITQDDVDKILAASGDGIKGITSDWARDRGLPPDADERMLVSAGDQAVGQDQLLWYIGKKAIGRQGCFACHNIPGFENAKPIGTPLNDWGKKDAERLAFEDSVAFVHEHYRLVSDPGEPYRLMQRKSELEKRKAESNLTEGEQKELASVSERLETLAHADKDHGAGKPPYEQFYFDALEHHQRTGFLHQKLTSPRSYDFHRDRAWDDRLRMPQFDFARTRRHKGESDEEYEARSIKEEAEAREAVMTFILGLVAEPTPESYLNRPGPDRLAEIKGRKVLEKYNCGGCHPLRAGVYEFKPTNDALQTLDQAFNAVRGQLPSDHQFLESNAWKGPPRLWHDRLTAFGTAPRVLELEEGKPVQVVRLAQALRYENTDKEVRDIPAGANAFIHPDAIIARSLPFGGAFVEAMIPYLNKRDSQRFKIQNDDSADARNVLPPPLLREGERAQPEWLFQFLRNPGVIRPVVLLRMPRFNFSDEEAMALVNYFNGADRSSNPGIGLNYPYQRIEQRDETYWRDMTRRYKERLGPEKVAAKAKQMQPFWQMARADQVTEAERKVDVAKRAVTAAQDAEKNAPMAKKADAEAARKAAEDERDRLQKELDRLKDLQKNEDYAAFKEEWESRGVYAVDAYRLLTAPQSPCLGCHQVGNVAAKEAQGPNLQLAFSRLRPDWTVQWLGNPRRVFGYDTIMPQNFPKGAEQYKELYEGNSLEQVTALRDALMNFDWVTSLPENRYARTASEGGK